MPEPERIDRRRAVLICYDVCRRALTPSDPARSAVMRPVLDAWVRMIRLARAAGLHHETPEAPEALLTKVHELFPTRQLGVRYEGDVDTDGTYQDLRPEAFHELALHFLGDERRSLVLDRLAVAACGRVADPRPVTVV